MTWCRKTFVEKYLRRRRGKLLGFLSQKKIKIRLKQTKNVFGGCGFLEGRACTPFPPSATPMPTLRDCLNPFIYARYNGAATSLGGFKIFLMCHCQTETTKQYIRQDYTKRVITVHAELIIPQVLSRPCRHSIERHAIFVKLYTE